MFEPWQLAAIDDAGYNGICEEHIERVAESLLSTGLNEIDRSTFDYHCHKCGIDPNNFTQVDLDRLQEKLYDYCGSEKNVIIPEGVTSIGGSAFEYCTSLTSITIPDGITSIGDWAFVDGCTNLTIHAPAGSYAEKYAKENEIKFIAE